MWGCWSTSANRGCRPTGRPSPTWSPRSTSTPTNTASASGWSSTDGSTRSRAPFTSGASRDTTPRWSPDGHAARVRHAPRRQRAVSSTSCPSPVAARRSVSRRRPRRSTTSRGRPTGRRSRSAPAIATRTATARPSRRTSRRVASRTCTTAPTARASWSTGPAGSSPCPPTAAPSRRALTDGEWGDNGLTWSPDGKWIAFSSARHDTWDLDRRVGPVARQGRRQRAGRATHRDRLQLQPPVVLARRRRHRVRRRARRRAARQRPGRRARGRDRATSRCSRPRSTGTACRTCGARASRRGTATTSGSPPRTAATSRCTACTPIPTRTIRPVPS